MNYTRLSCLVIGFLLVAATAHAHFGMVIPSAPTVMEAKNAKVSLSLKFWHPFENVGMNLEKPAKFTVFHNGEPKDLLETLKEGSERGMKV